MIMSMNSDKSGSGSVIYLDNGATSFPKPPQVIQAMNHWFSNVGGSPGRSGHRLSTESARIVFETRELLAGLIGAESSRQIVFTKNATEAINTAFLGILSKGDHVVTTTMEHNSVMRPLRYLAGNNTIQLTVVKCDGGGRLDPEDVAGAFRKNTRMLVITHASNVTGIIMPLEELGRICQKSGVLFLVDAAQTAGALPIDVAAAFVDLLAFTGHKSLFGPTGTGGLYIKEGIKLRPLTRGGTGSNSELEEQPDFLPDSLESGTQNALGISGLKAGIEFIVSTSVERIRKEEVSLTAGLLEGLREIPGVTIYGPGIAGEMMPVVSFTIDGLAPSEIGYILDEAFGIMTRVGLHCAPSAHRTTGTFPSGTVRLTPGFFNTSEDIAYTLNSIETIATRRTGS